MPQPGSLFDGLSARAHPVMASASGASLRLDGDGGWSDEIPAASLRSIAEHANRLRIGRKDADGWCLVLPRPVDAEISSLLPSGSRYGRWIDRIGLVPALVVGAIVTAAVLAIGYLAPHWIAPHVSISWERDLGGAVVGDFGKLRCRNANGQRALEALVERVAPGAIHGPNGIKVAALDVPVFNAAALPGGYIVVFKPAITETDSDALAGVIAHEVAHVRRRHVTEALLRELGIGAMVRMLAGNVGADAEQIVSLSYTRDNEAQADADAIQMLKRAGISPRPTAALFKRLAKEAPEYSAQFLQSHPASATRAEHFAASFDAHARYQPALRRDQSDALFDICFSRPS